MERKREWGPLDDLESMLHNSLKLNQQPSDVSSSIYDSSESSMSNDRIRAPPPHTLDPRAQAMRQDILKIKPPISNPPRTSSKSHTTQQSVPHTTQQSVHSVPHGTPHTVHSTHAVTSKSKHANLTQAVPAPQASYNVFTTPRQSPRDLESLGTQRQLRLAKIAQLEAEQTAEMASKSVPFDLQYKSQQLDHQIEQEVAKAADWRDLEHPLKPQNTAPVRQPQLSDKEMKRASAPTGAASVASTNVAGSSVASGAASATSASSSTNAPRVVKKGVEDFDFKQELGMGSYSTVVAATDKQTLRQYAVKILDKAHIIKEQKVKYVEIEKRTLNRLGDHPGIIRLYFTFQDKYSLYFVLDFAPNGELLHLIKRIGTLNEACARYYACQLLDAIEYMHTRGVIHRDLKPENILLDYKMRLKITDFGTAKLLEADPVTGEYPQDTRANSFVGTAEYVSPELLVGKTQTKSADIWAWGCVLYQMIAAVPPFQGNTQYLTFQKVARLQYTIPPGFPFLVRDLLKHVLVKAPQRWTIDMIKQHDFFEGQDWSRKYIWSSPPPKFEPYRATVSSMKPRNLSQRPSRPEHSLAQAKMRAESAPRPAFVPTRDGLQPVKPATVHGMPVNHNKRVPSPTQASQASMQGTPGLYKSPPSTSNAYKQSQNRIEDLKRRMQEQRLRTTSNVSAATTVQSNVSAMTTATKSRAKPTLEELSREPEKELPKLPLTKLESQWSSVLTSSHERILKYGQMEVYVSAHPPVQIEEKGSNKADKSVVYQEDSFFTKLLSNRNRFKTVMVTTWGRLLIIGQDKKLQHEIPVGLPQVSVHDVIFLANKKHTPRIIIQTYNKVYTLDEPGQISDWMSAINLSRRYYTQTIAEQEKRAFNVAAAAASAVSARR